MTARRACLSLATFMTVLGISFQAWSLELTDKYLEGKWALDGASCADTNSEFVIFRGTGAVEEIRNGRLEAAGFWELGDNIVTVHVVASPAFFQDGRAEAADLKAFEGEYYAFRIRVVPFSVEADQFGAVGILGEQVNRAVFNRCKT